MSETNFRLKDKLKNRILVNFRFYFEAITFKIKLFEKYAEGVFFFNFSTFDYKFQNGI